jgi:hypothetical protein
MYHLYHLEKKKFRIGVLNFKGIDILVIYENKKRRSRTSGIAKFLNISSIQNVILLSVSAMLASNEDLRKSMTFLIPGVKLVVKTLPSESFRLMVQLKSLEEIWKRSSSLRVCTSLALFSMTSWRFSILRIFSIMVISFFGSGAGMTDFSGSISRTGFFSSVLFSAGLRIVFTMVISSAEGFPLPGFRAVFVNLVI